MIQDFLYRRTVDLSMRDALLAWCDVEVLREWFWTTDDTEYITIAGRGLPFRVSSEKRELTIEGTCLNIDPYGFDCTWTATSPRLQHNSTDTLSVRLRPDGCQRTVMVLTYAIDSEIENFGEMVDNFWTPILDRYSQLGQQLAMSA
ncbi:hypothetical protein [Calidifontibacter terrae]